ncbi:transporter substrate-binding domain-containing protein [Actinoplanes derwentensis]|uniref:Amino acid ABC transporter substrate-binding protein, PAAT family n=1 Tax=Actinoplanes derwentensis TaxID=113562 RepID=A0A1H1ZUN7_9ACTN|nr:transporter substrate-binding domain-containing protein [Actinoplanes derwentensis]GID83535.1 glutamate-binding protein [Actinoplanes derwentensis]SDT37444.1 amino acid ABC transporter substrate-binding protein, PAAT family [Actinoplanes derwentensis]
MRFRPLLAAVLAATLMTTAGCQDSELEPDPAEYLSGEVLIGINTDLPGWSEYANGVWQGFDISLSNWLGEELGFRPRYVNLTTNERLTALQDADSEVKLVISNFSINDKRRETIDQVGPYFADSQGLLTLTTSKIMKVEDIERKTICTALGSTTEVRLFGMTINPLSENTLQRCLQRLRAGEADAVSSDRAILEGFISHDTARDLRLVPGIRVGSERYGIGIHNNSPKLCDYLSKKLVKFINEEWDQTFTNNLPNVIPTDRKPNSAALDPCEKPVPS